MLDLAIVIANYNTRDKLRDCLASIAGSQGKLAVATWVVDNASSDGSVDMVRQAFPGVNVIASSVNGGFAYANNLGLRAAGFHPIGDEAPRSAREMANLPTAGATHPDPPRYALLLNPDTVLPPTALSDMVAYLDGRPDLGAAGPRLVRADGSLDLACRRSFPTPEVSFYRMVGLSRLFPRSRRFGRYNLTYLDPDQETEVDSVVGAFMMVRREAIQDAGLLDERFFMYGEDLDWALRMKQAGWKVYYNPNVTVLHYKRAASAGSERASFEFYRAMYLFYEKHYAADTPFWLHWPIMAGIALKGGRRLMCEMGGLARRPAEVAP
ncbi:MAG: glycosyltransferase family 2 protein [Anaerolineae bacterium]